MAKMQRRYAVSGQRGFTLVEMSVVLVVIGLILGAVSIGKDVQRDAEYSKIKQKFIDGWVSAYNSHYQRTGVVVGDSQVAPNFMVNGAAYAAATSGGNMGTPDTSAVGAICQGALPGDTGITPGTVPATTLHAFFDKAGVRMPPGRAEGSEDRYVYLDTNGNPQEIRVCFQWNKPGRQDNAGNVMIITGLTPDLARALDQMIDGKADASNGLFRQLNSAASTNVGNPGTEWASTNRDAYGVPALPGAAVVPKDENQVNTVVAVYKMNQ